MRSCEVCGAPPPAGAPGGPPGLFDYCGTCSRNLCPGCMAKGCCGAVPAVNGEDVGALPGPGEPSPPPPKAEENWRQENAEVLALRAIETIVADALRSPRTPQSPVGTVFAASAAKPFTAGDFLGFAAKVSRHAGVTRSSFDDAWAVLRRQSERQEPDLVPPLDLRGMISGRTQAQVPNQKAPGRSGRSIGDAETSHTVLDIEGGTPRTILVGPGVDRVELGFPGYGVAASARPHGRPVIVEYRDGVPYVLVWADIASEDPTHVIGLAGAAEAEPPPEHRYRLPSRNGRPYLIEWDGLGTADGLERAVAIALARVDGFAAGGTLEDLWENAAGMFTPFTRAMAERRYDLRTVCPADESGMSPEDFAALPTLSWFADVTPGSAPA